MLLPRRTLNLGPDGVQERSRRNSCCRAKHCMEMPDHWIRWRSPKISSRYWTDSALGRRLRPITCGIVGCYRVPTSATISSIDSPAWGDRFRRAGASRPTSDSTTPVSGRHMQMTSPSVGCGTPAGHQGDGRDAMNGFTARHFELLDRWKSFGAPSPLFENPILTPSDAPRRSGSAAPGPAPGSRVSHARGSGRFR